MDSANRCCIELEALLQRHIKFTKASVQLDGEIREGACILVRQKGWFESVHLDRERGLLTTDLHFYLSR